MKKKSGRWEKRFAMLDGDVPFEMLKTLQSSDLITPSGYSLELNQAGFTNTLTKVLALEQGQTDQLCSRSAKGLLDLMLDVHGDKEIIDRYKCARENYQAASMELNLLAAKCERRDGNIGDAIARLENMDRGAAPGRSAINIEFELGRLTDQQGEYERAFAYYSDANRRSRDYSPHAAVDKNRFLDMLASLDSALSEDWIGAWTETPELSGRQTPVFLFGFPRSGTTLVEQVLASYPDIAVLDEQPAVDDMLSLIPDFPESYPRALADLTADRIMELRARYFETADAFTKGAHNDLLIDKMPLKVRYCDVTDYPLSLCFKIGLFQCLALIPGTSRSGATIAGSLLMGTDKRSAAEFSFFLAMPTMMGAFVFELYQNRDALSASDVRLIAVGFIMAFLAAVLVVKHLLGFVSKHGFAPFAWWRIVIGTLGILALLTVG